MRAVFRPRRGRALTWINRAALGARCGKLPTASRIAARRAWPRHQVVKRPTFKDLMKRLG
jgi:hypothetical protein